MRILAINISKAGTIVKTVTISIPPRARNFSVTIHLPEDLSGCNLDGPLIVVARPRLSVVTDKATREEDVPQDEGERHEEHD